MSQTLNQRFLDKLTASLNLNEESKLAFETVLKNGTVKSTESIISFIPKDKLPFQTRDKARWEPEFIFHPETTAKLGNFLEYIAGGYYVLDNSSVFAASILKEVIPSVKERIQQKEKFKILDLCSAPGGKAIFCYAQFKEYFAECELTCNEVIGKRIPALLSNLKRCSVPFKVVHQKDTDVLASNYQEYFDLIIVDAPCSGQSLLAKGQDSPGCLNPRVIETNQKRQRRILSNANSMLKPGGFIGYMTCTFSLEENEKNVEWLLSKNKELTTIIIPHLENLFRSPYTINYTYRIWPQGPLEERGAGAFTTLIKKHVL